MKNKEFSTVDYFNARAMRYSLALKECELSRTLDVIPYLFFLNKFKKDKIKILDAFGGTGYFAKTINNKYCNFTIADASFEMINQLDDVKNVSKIVANDDFDSVKKKFKNNKFDIVISHGGFHHAIIYKDVVKIKESKLKQNYIAENLSSIVSKDGYFILSDIPDSNSYSDVFIHSDPETDISISLNQMQNMISQDKIEFLSKILNIKKTEIFKLSEFQQLINNSINQKNVSFEVPKYFFNSYIARNTKLGHKASYINFDEIDQVIIRKGFKQIARLNLRTPWVFNSKHEVAWFFKEKFSIGKSTPIEESFLNENKLYEMVDKYLGVEVNNGLYMVNWGVTYSIFKKI
ncbi:MAG: methyltransferase domain-containing protein [Flavobacteriales bacterium]|nr:methyltransferase domain-containing protein [Flavobacteriales bacterium]